MLRQVTRSAPLMYAYLFIHSASCNRLQKKGQIVRATEIRRKKKLRLCASMHINTQQCVFYTVISGFKRANSKHMVFFMLHTFRFPHTLAKLHEISLLIVSTKSKENMFYSSESVIYKWFAYASKQPKHLQAPKHTTEQNILYANRRQTIPTEQLTRIETYVKH